jgi:DNA primase
MAQQHGLDNVVAVLGTALGESHVKLLQQNRADSITLVLDGDAAGRRRTNEIIDTLLALFVKNQIDLKILTLPEGVDPCDFISSHGCDAFRQLLTTAVDALEHKFLSVSHGLDTSTDTHRAAQAAEQMLATLAHIRPSADAASSPVLLREQQMLGRISRRFQLPEDQLRNRLVALRRARQSRPTFTRSDAPHTAPAAPHASASLAAWDRDLLALILLDPSFVPRIDAVMEQPPFTSDVAARIYEACLRLAHDGEKIDFARLSLEFDDLASQSLLVTLDEICQDEKRQQADREQWLQDLLASAERRRNDRNRRSSLAAAKSNQEDAEALLARFHQESRAKQLSEYERRKK